MSSPEPSSLRAGNDDREKVVARLNTAFAEGRLDVAELDERVAAAYRAKTLGELVPLTVDLPASYQLPSTDRSVARPTAAAPQRPHGMHGGHGGHGGQLAPIAGALGLFLVNVLIWAAVSLDQRDMVYFWPIWTAIPLVFAVVGTIGQRRSR